MWNKILARWAHLVRDTRGQDMVEYALLAGFLAVAAGATLPGVSERIGTIFERTNDVLEQAAGTERGDKDPQDASANGTQG